MWMAMSRKPVLLVGGRPPQGSLFLKMAFLVECQTATLEISPLPLQLSHMGGSGVRRLSGVNASGIHRGAFTFLKPVRSHVSRRP